MTQLLGGIKWNLHSKIMLRKVAIKFVVLAFKSIREAKEQTF